VPEFLTRTPWRIAALALVLALILVPFLACRRSSQSVAPSKPPSGPLSGVLVVLDPGHGGQDSGAVRGGMREDALNYRLAAGTATALRRRGATVWLTVTSDALTLPGSAPLKVPSDARLVFNNEPLRVRHLFSANDLWRRAALVRKAVKENPGKRVFFLSLHADSLESGRWWGARVYRDTRDKGECRFARELLARLTRENLTFTKNAQIIPRDYGVLNPQYNPASQKALLEAFTISSKHDRIRARSPEWRWKVARIVAESVEACVKK
jgi:N-acetylmuramoyl-L-alanine amidase